MKLGTEDKKKLPILAVAGAGAIGAVIYIISQFSAPSVPPPPAVPVIATTPSRPVTTASATTAPQLREATIRMQDKPTGASQYDPTLKMDAMLVTESLIYTGSGRNIFSTNSAPAAAVAIPQSKFPARPTLAQAIAAAPTGPPPPPPIDLKFFGMDTGANGTRQAFLLHGDDVYLASTGDIVQRRYRVGAITANNIEVEDLTNNNKQTLPLLK